MVGMNILDASSQIVHAFLAVTGRFRLFVVALCSLLGYKGKNGTGQRVNADTSLTTNHLLRKGKLWLLVRLNVHPNPFQVTTASQKSKGRLWNWSKWTTTPAQSSSCSMTTPCLDSISIPATLYSRNCQTGEREIGNQSNSGHQFTAQFPWSNGRSAFTHPNHEPAYYRRVLSFSGGVL